MRRRTFIEGLGSAAAWPLVARAQQGARMRRIGLILPGTADDSVFQTWVAAFHQGLAQFGWVIGRNVQIDMHWAGAKADDIRKHAQELTASAPEAILAHGSSTLRPLLEATRTIPIVFVVVDDPVGGGLVQSLPQPGGNVTGFMSNEYSIGGKYLELLKEIAPAITRAAVLRDATQGATTGEFAVIQAMGSMLRVQASPIGMRDADEIEHGVATFAQSSNGGLIVPGGSAARNYRDKIIALAARHKLPTVYAIRHYAVAGGLIAFGPDLIDQYQKAAGYVDRILKGEKPADLPVQAPTKYETVLNMKTAKTLGLNVPPSILLRADEVIE